MARVKHATRSAGDAHLLPGLPNTSSRFCKQARVRDVLRKTGRLLKRKRDVEGEVGDLQQELATPSSPSPRSKERRDSSNKQPPQTRASGVLADKRAEGWRQIKNNSMGYNGVNIHEDNTVPPQHQQAAQSQAAVMAEKDLNVQMSGVDDEDEDEDDTDNEIDETVAEDMRKLEENFKGISQKYRLINRIGEGTFSTVYKAEQLDLPTEDDTENEDPSVDLSTPPAKRRKYVNGRHHRFVALKKIYVTSSPSRILNELELLHELRNSDFICPLLTAFRHLDQVVAVLPYFRHLDFRLYYREFLTNDLRHYFLSLFSGLAYVHKAGIIHRDIKPTNFLYDHTQKHGMLVDFGLAERQGTDWQPCFCQESREDRRERFLNSYAVQNLQRQPDLLSNGYPKQDNRPSRRANRAGTRGFRAPEVLLKCTAQTTKIDIWSAGVILLTLLGRRFPFFNSADDIDAMIEIASIFGKKKMQGVAAMHGSVFETNIETIGERGFTLEKIVLWAACREKEDGELHPGEVQAVHLLTGLLELDPNKRLSAKQALNHEFFTKPIEDDYERAEREYQERAEEDAAAQAEERARRKKAKAKAQMA